MSSGNYSHGGARGDQRRSRSPDSPSRARRPSYREERGYEGPGQHDHVYDQRRRRESRASSSRPISTEKDGHHDYQAQQRDLSQAPDYRPSLPDHIPLPEKSAIVPYKELAIQGTNGKTITVLTNHFPIQSLPTRKVFQYQIFFHVPPASRRRGSEKVSVGLKAKTIAEGRKLNLGPDFVFDGVSNGWSATHLMAVGESRELTVNLDGHTIEKPNQVTIKVKNVGPVSIIKIINHVQPRAIGIYTRDPELEDAFKFLNALFRQDPASRFITRPNSSAFYQRGQNNTAILQSTGGILEAIRGFYQAISVAFGRLCVNVDTSTTVFYAENNLAENVRVWAGAPNRSALLQPAKRAAVNAALQRLVGHAFVVKHLSASGNSRRQKIAKIAGVNANFHRFEAKPPLQGCPNPVNVREYFLEKYGIKLELPEVPLLETATGSLFPIEVCYMPHDERFKEALQGRETADFIKFATSPAFVRSAHIRDNLTALHWHQLSTLSSCGISVTPKMMEVRARQHAPPVLQYRNAGEKIRPAHGKWNMVGKSFFEPAGFRTWGFCYFPGPGHVRPVGIQQLTDFARTMYEGFKKYGLSLPSRPPCFHKASVQGDVADEIGKLLSTIKNETQASPDMVFFVIHDGSGPHLYKAIKHTCEVKLGVKSQVMKAEKCLSGKGTDQYVANIALKVNCKTGGINNIVHEALFQAHRWMMIGGDVSHPSPAELRRLPPPPSYVGLVGSYDANCCRYTAVKAAQPHGEIVATIKPMFKALLKRCQGWNKAHFLPQRIIYWRDGLSDSQIQQFHDTEVTALRHAIEELDSKIAISVVVCTKRHHTRFFAKSKNEGDKLGNVRPGTVVENSENHDVYLVSHAGLQGTVRPCHYRMVLDENDLTADEFQRLCNDSTYSYGRATRSVSLHPAVYYADQVAERAKVHLAHTHKQTTLMDVHENLSKTMWWQ